MKIFCQSCGQEVKTYEIICSKCSAQLSVPNIPSYTNLSVVAMVLLFFPTGLVALINSIQVNNKIKEGNFLEAIRYSKRALFWVLISLGILLLYLAFYFLYRK
jgi:hypothetical protein